MNIKNPYTLGAICLIVGLGLGYFGSHAFAASPLRSASGFARGAGGTGTFTRGAAGGMGGLLTGSVTDITGTSLTLDTRDGNSHVVLLSPTTVVSKSVTGALSDITTGSMVTVIGTANSDGSTLATTIQLRPATTSAMMGGK